MNNAPTGPQRILTRLKPCHCGCKGEDSWHKPTIKRVIRDFARVVPTNPEPHTFVNVAHGFARMPWGLEAVVGNSIVYADGSLARGINWRLAELR